MAEVYWDMEWALQQQGFDLCYDKRLYDRLVHDSADSVRGHLQADPVYQEHLIRFIENHDEPRAAATFDPPKARAAAVAISTPGGRAAYPRRPARRTGRASVFTRGPDEHADSELHAFYARLLCAVGESGLRAG